MSWLPRKRTSGAVAGGGPRRPPILLLALLACVISSGGAQAGSVPENAIEVFRARCSRCHGEDGRSDTPTARAFKVRPMQYDASLAHMTRAEIVLAVKRNAKHAALVKIRDQDLELAALVVLELARDGQATANDVAPRDGGHR